jgi:hypothetical protein
MSTALDEIRHLLSERDALYSRADASVDTSGKAPARSLTELKRTVSTEQ